MAILASLSLVLPASLVYQRMTSFKGAIAGMVVGAVAGMVFDPLRSEKENAHLKKKAARMLKAAGQIVDNFTGL
jgi:gas vesicle protein